MNSYSVLFIRRMQYGRYLRATIRSAGTTWDEEGEKKLSPKHFLLLVCPMTAFCLGYWQIQRRRWKLDLIEKINSVLPLAPIALPKEVMASTDLPEFQPVTVEGHFDHLRECVIGPRNIITDDIAYGGYGSAWGSKPPLDNYKESNLSNFGAPSASGYCIVTPFELHDRPGTFILINRGWIPTFSRDPITRLNGQIEGTIKVTGYIRYNENPPPFAPDPKPLHCAKESQAPHQQYFSREVLRMSEHLDTLPLFVDANYESSVRGGPIGGQTKVVIHNNHTQYIFTWFSLGTLTLGMWMYWLFF